MLAGVIRDDWVKARKSYNAETSKVLGFLYASIQTKIKEKGSVTDDDVIATIKNLIAKNADLISLYGSKTTAGNMISDAVTENRILYPYLPEMVSEEKIRETVSAYLALTTKPNMGQMMAGLKSSFGQTIDMKLASKIIKEMTND